MSNADASRSDTPPIRQKAGRGLLVGMALALVVVSAVCAYALFKLRGAPHASGAETAKVQADAPVLYLSLDPAFVVNFHNPQSASYLQVGVTLMAHDSRAIQAAKDADPVVRNALVLLFSSQNYDELSTTAGKQKLREDALHAVQKVVEERLGRPGIDALYFTSFVMQ
jgi:flagellar FliL protein